MAWLFPGTGYGGSCFPKDVKALIATGRSYGCPMKILAAVNEVNEAQKTILVRKLMEEFGEGLQGRRFAIWGLAFKPNTDDVREAPSLQVIRALVDLGAQVCAYDPVATENARAALSALHGVTFARDAYEAADGADALLIVTEWGEFRSPDLGRLLALMRRPLILDGRNILDGVRVKEAGFAYRGIGRS